MAEKKAERASKALTDLLIQDLRERAVELAKKAGLKVIIGRSIKDCSFRYDVSEKDERKIERDAESIITSDPAMRKLVEMDRSVKREAQKVLGQFPDVDFSQRYDHYSDGPDMDLTRWHSNVVECITSQRKENMKNTIEEESSDLYDKFHAQCSRRLQMEYVKGNKESVEKLYKELEEELIKINDRTLVAVGKKQKKEKKDAPIQGLGL